MKLRGRDEASRETSPARAGSAEEEGKPAKGSAMEEGDGAGSGDEQSVGVEGEWDSPPAGH